MIHRRGVTHVDHMNHVSSQAASEKERHGNLDIVVQVINSLDTKTRVDSPNK